MAEASLSASASLQLGTIPHPALEACRVPFFRDWLRAFCHLRDHLLTDPEGRAWAVVIPEYRNLVDPEDPEACYRYVEAARTSQGVSAQPLYDLYCQAAALDAQDAAQLGWVDTSEGVTVSVGTSGIGILIKGAVVRTAFLPGQGDPLATCEARRQGHGGGASSVRGLPRERGMRSGRAALLARVAAFANREPTRNAGRNWHLWSACTMTCSRKACSISDKRITHRRTCMARKFAQIVPV